MQMTTYNRTGTIIIISNIFVPGFVSTVALYDRVVVVVVGSRYVIIHFFQIMSIFPGSIILFYSKILHVDILHTTKLRTVER